MYFPSHFYKQRQGEEGKNFLTTATKQSFLPPNFEDRTQELLLEVIFIFILFCLFLFKFSL